MFDYEAQQQDIKPDKRDWSGTIIGLCLSSVILIFIYLGKPDLGFTIFIALAGAAGAVKLRWKLRRYWWLWATVVLILAIQFPLLRFIRWPNTNVPTLVYSFPLGIAEYFITSWAIRLAESIFLKTPSDNE